MIKGELVFDASSIKPYSQFEVGLGFQGSCPVYIMFLFCDYKGTHLIDAYRTFRNLSEKFMVIVSLYSSIWDFFGILRQLQI